ncbi:MAG: phosphoribosylanthranilate isomerase [Spirochaetaceae bacterium]|jgi:phosphoribosylanthranilate isomerase|nr:phosphoribosylanthranilate isomerase [Spirochaetaceae bacterium]
MKVKICGLFREEDIDFVNDAKPDYAGFVFAASRRQLDFKTARKLRSKLVDGIVPVGVFVNAEIGTIEALYSEGIIGAAQLHGGEDEAYIERLKKRCRIQVIKTVICSGPCGAGDLIQAGSAADFLLFDSGAGSGRNFDWNILDFKNKAQKPSRPWFLAGGINQDNIAKAMPLNPFCIDVSSGVESGGVKDGEKIKTIVSAVRKGWGLPL